MNDPRGALDYCDVVESMILRGVDMQGLIKMLEDGLSSHYSPNNMFDCGHASRYTLHEILLLLAHPERVARLEELMAANENAKKPKDRWFSSVLFWKS